MGQKYRVLVKQQLEIGGNTRTYQVGDMVEIGRKDATRLIGMGMLELAANGGKLDLPPIGKPMAISPNNPGAFNVPRDVLLIWDGIIPLPREKMEAGLKVLDRWQVAVPLACEDTLAATIGSQEERDRTLAVIRDLRVPVYETGLMFIRRCDATSQLLATWQEEEMPHGDTRLAFLRALYLVKPIILALPYTWVEPDAKK